MFWGNLVLQRHESISLPKKMLVVFSTISFQRKSNFCWNVCTYHMAYQMETRNYYLTPAASVISNTPLLPWYLLCALSSNRWKIKRRSRLCPISNSDHMDYGSIWNGCSVKTLSSKQQKCFWRFAFFELWKQQTHRLESVCCVSMALKGNM